MAPASQDVARDVAQRVSRYVHDRVQGWRTGSWQSQLYVLGVLLVGVTVSWVVSWHYYDAMPLATYFVWLLLGMLLLRFRPLAALAVYAPVVAIASVLHDGPLSGPRLGNVIALVVSVALILWQSSRQRSGLPSTLSEAMLSDLRDRLQSQSTVPALPDGWQTDSSMIASHGVGYAGDFLVADLSADGTRLEMVLVDVCGKGVAAGSQALHFAGALGGLLGALDQPALFHAANAFLLRQHADESFSTAVHLRVDLPTGAYVVTSAGHPPALRWDSTRAEWVLDNARGLALGILPEPDLDSSRGVLQPGEALLFYTDGVVESRSADLDVGIEWLRTTAAAAIARGYTGAARRIVRQVKRGDDDRAVLILSRGATPAPSQSREAARPTSRPATSAPSEPSVSSPSVSS